MIEMAGLPAFVISAGGPGLDILQIAERERAFLLRRAVQQLAPLDPGKETGKVDVIGLEAMAGD